MQVSLSYVRDVAQRDGTSALKLAPHLKDKHLDPNHYEKMSVSSALAVLNHSTGSAIRVLVKEGKMSPAAVTTAWFLETVYKWFRLMTSRTKSLAMSELNSRKHDDAVEFLSEVLDLFKKMTIHLPGKSPSWKPVQTGVVISTTAALSLQNLYLTQYNFKYLFLSRLTQDALENLFSVIRQKNATPRPLQFKTALRTITLSQFFQPCRTGNYEMDDAEYLADFISKRQAESPSEEVLQQDGASAIQDESAWELPDDDDQMLAQVVDVLSDSQAAMGELQSTDKQSLHYLCGYTVKAVCGKYKLCETCRSALTDTENKENASLTEFKSYRDTSEQNPLCMVSLAVFAMLEKCEVIFRSQEASIVDGTANLANLSAQALCEFSRDHLPTCHGVAQKLVDAFLLMRLRFALRKSNERYAAKQNNTRCGSRSIGMRGCVNAVR